MTGWLRMIPLQNLAVGWFLAEATGQMSFDVQQAANSGLVSWSMSKCSGGMWQLHPHVYYISIV